MIVIGTIIFPETSANAVAECYQTLPAMPDFMTIDGTYVHNNSGEDFRAFSIFNFDEAHIEAANRYFKARYEAFGIVEGLTSHHEEWLSVQDALALVEAGTYNLKTL
ncbi:MAG: hypothetical protein KKF12_10240 [Proteobacteria bacterium]|nr:hypothetical protein [Pseudomonadota bacterium]MBU4131186.1 hypothetical protein [Pseudomonadota bacterium]